MKLNPFRIYFIEINPIDKPDRNHKQSEFKRFTLAIENLQYFTSKNDFSS